MKQEIEYLNVPFREKDVAKALGAKWDPERKKWYVPTDVPIYQFDRWRVEEPGDASSEV